MISIDDFTHLADTGVENFNTTKQRTATVRDLQSAMAVAILKAGRSDSAQADSAGCDTWLLLWRPVHINMTDLVKGQKHDLSMFGSCGFLDYYLKHENVTVHTIIQFSAIQYCLSITFIAFAKATHLLVLRRQTLSVTRNDNSQHVGTAKSSRYFRGRLVLFAFVEGITIKV